MNINLSITIYVYKHISMYVSYPSISDNFSIIETVWHEDTLPKKIHLVLHSDYSSCSASKKNHLKHRKLLE